jgi:hypothetical protein
MSMVGFMSRPLYPQDNNVVGVRAEAKADEPRARPACAPVTALNELVTAQNSATLNEEPKSI